MPYKFCWSPMEFTGLWWTPVNLLETTGVWWVRWSPAELISRKVQHKSRESTGTWHILVEYTGLDMPIWPVWHWKSLGDKSCGFQQTPVESNKIWQIVWDSVQSFSTSPPNYFSFFLYCALVLLLAIESHPRIIASSKFFQISLL